ncbi:tail assembly chaperone [Shewanella phage SppYZU05]|uniref:Tail assembly chaperone n=1 Tax=Shewanella phage SppYZU05 TaxID=1970795 RepID=A0A1W6JTG4_9CAUD|nr:tail assembly chaperone [Shewanella phage SppYZU05]ARM70537.1 hypothetical protein SppYZU05_11 [Shewanella phage SppYZU05]
MACKDLHREILGRQVYARQWPATMALENLSLLLTTFNTTAQVFINGSYKIGDCAQLLYTPKHKEVVQTIHKFCYAARIDGKEIRTPVEFDALYNGDLPAIFATFAMVCELNYKDFFASGVTQQQQDQVSSTNSEASQTEPTT